MVEFETVPSQAEFENAFYTADYVRMGDTQVLMGDDVKRGLVTGGQYNCVVPIGWGTTKNGDPFLFLSHVSISDRRSEELALHLGVIPKPEDVQDISMVFIPGPDTADEDSARVDRIKEGFVRRYAGVHVSLLTPHIFLAQNPEGIINAIVVQRATEGAVNITVAGFVPKI